MLEYIRALAFLHSFANGKPHISQHLCFVIITSTCTKEWGKNVDLLQQWIFIRKFVEGSIGQTLLLIVTWELDIFRKGEDREKNIQFD